jgi:hypothetical protein
MAEQPTVDQNFFEFRGVDLTSNHVKRDPRYAVNAQNVEPIHNGSLSLRQGQMLVATDKHGYYPICVLGKYFNGTDEETLGIGRGYDSDSVRLMRLATGTVTVTYSGTGTGKIKIYPFLDSGTGKYRFKIELLDGSGASVYTRDLGNYKHETSPLSNVSIVSMVAGIDALASFACTTTVSGTSYDAFQLGILDQDLPTGSAVVLPFEYWEEIYKAYLSALPYIYHDDSDAGDVSSRAQLLEHDGRLFAIGAERLGKYDGKFFYRAGMPRATALSGALGAAGALTGSYYYTITYEFTDYRGHVVEGNESNEITLTPSAQRNSITIPYLREVGFLSNTALVVGNQTGVTTINTDDGGGGSHTMQIGMKAYFYDGVSGAYVTRNITGRTNSSITISGAAVNVSDNAVISPGLKVNLWRNKAGGVKKYLVVSLPNQENTASVVYSDNTADSALGVEQVLPFEDLGHGEPPMNPQCGAVYRNLLVLGTGSDGVNYSDPEGPEYFVEGGSTAKLRTRSGKPIHAMGAIGDLLAVFKTNETHVFQGDFTGASYTQSLLDGSSGCDSQHTIQDCNGSLWYYSHLGGVSRLSANGAIERMSRKIDPALQLNNVVSWGYNNAYSGWFSDTTALRHQHARACYEPLANCYHLFVPSFNAVAVYFPASGKTLEFASDTDSVFLTCNIENQYGSDDQGPMVFWWPQKNILPMGGMIVMDELLTWCEWFRDPSAGGGAIAQVTGLQQRLNTRTIYDFTDHAQPISMFYETDWFDFQTPAQFKKFIRAAVFSFRQNVAVATAFSVTTVVDIRYQDGIRKEEALLTFQYDTALNLDSIFEGIDLDTIETQAVKLRFENTAVWCQRPIISGVVVEAVNPFAPVVQK